MEDLTAVVFIGLAIVAAVKFVKGLVPNINGSWTILLSAVLGLLVALFDTHLGLDNITPAVGIMTGLGASGSITLARNLTSAE